MPGDSIEIVNGWIYRNGELYVDSFSDVNVTSGISINPIFLGEKEYWVIGDNRGESWYGIIDEEQIVGQYYE